MSHSLNSYIDRELFVTTAHDKWIKKSWVSTTRVNEIRKSFLVINRKKEKNGLPEDVMPPSVVKDLRWRVTEKHFRNDIDRADPSFWHRDGQDDPLRSLLPLWVCDAQFLSRACTKANKQPCT